MVHARPVLRREAGFRCGRRCFGGARKTEQDTTPAGHVLFGKVVSGRSLFLRLLEFARSAGKELRFFSAMELNQIPVPTPSAAAEQQLGLHSVSEAAALLAAGPDARLLVPKQSRSDVTAAVAVEVDHV